MGILVIGEKQVLGGTPLQENEYKITNTKLREEWLPTSNEKKSQQISNLEVLKSITFNKTRHYSVVNSVT